MQEETQNLADLLETSLPVALRHIPHRVRDIAHELEFSAALSGGIVRDLLRIRYGQLYKDQFSNELRDFDLVVAGRSSARRGAGVRFAYELARRLPGKLTVNEAFQTATLITNDPMRIDVTTARREQYPAPGQLPEIDILDIDVASDLARRDFTINALGIDLSEDYGRLIDTCGGSGDIADGLVRVLHPASFSDDPTRLLRAVRYSVRLNYDLEPTTRALYEAAVDDQALDHLTPERIRYEIECICREQRWVEILAALDVSRLLASLSRGLGGISARWDLDSARALDIAIANQPALMAQAEFEPWLVRLGWAIYAAPADLLESLSERLGLYKRAREWITQARMIIARETPQLASELTPSEVCRQLEHYSRQAVTMALFIFQPVTQEEVHGRRELKRYVEEYSNVRCELDGRELLEMGLKPGPLVGKIRDQLRYLRLDGTIKSQEEERKVARELINSIAKAGNGHPVRASDHAQTDDIVPGDEPDVGTADGDGD